MENHCVQEEVIISVSYVQFKTKRRLLNAFPGTQLANLDDSSKHFDKKDNVYIFDRDPELFRHILNAYRIKEVHIPRNYCPFVFKKELKFWEIPLKLVAPCCWQYLYDSEGTLDDLKVVMKEENAMKNYNAYNTKNQIIPEKNDVDTTKEKISKKNRTIKNEMEARNVSKLWLFLEEPGFSTAAKIWFYFYIFVVLVSVILFLIWLVPSVRVQRYLSALSENSIDVLSLNSSAYKALQRVYNEKIIMAGGTDPHPVLFTLDVFCFVFFSFELFLSMCVCPNKKEYFCNLNNLIKIIVCTCMAITLGLEVNKDILRKDIRIARFMMTCKALASLRLLLIFRLRKIFNSFNILLIALKHSLTELLLLLFTFLVLVIIYASLMFSAEIESDMFPNTQLTMWWAVITMTTIGYGDFYPVSTFGYIIGVACAINGIIVLALPVAAIAGTFSNLFSRNSELQRHKKAIADQKQVLSE